MRLAFFLVAFLSSSFCFAEFAPEEIVILSNSNSSDSVDIANYYAKLRKIPLSNIVQLNIPDNFNIDRQVFNEKIIAPLKLKIKDSKDLHYAKIIVTIYGVPLKIDGVETPENFLEVQEKLKNQTNALQLRLKKEIVSLNLLKEKLGNNEPQTDLESPIDFSILQQDLQRLYELTYQKNSSSKEFGEIKEISTNLFGIILLSQNIDEKAVNNLNLIKSTYAKIKKDLSSSKKVDLNDLEIVLEKSAHLKGIIGALIETKIMADRILANESSASLDSELALLWSLPDGSPISSRIPNPLFIENKLKDNLKFPMLLVSRLDGSTPEIVKRNILHTILTEKKGYQDSNFLIDSRGLSFEQRDELGDWDRKLVTLAKTNFGNKIEIEFDSNPTLSAKLGNISLYVGWYQLRNYQDNYAFNRGAIGYHIASEEAVNIHDINEKGWCKNLLDRGVVATVGAIEEPYLDSFPDPLYFFPLLATGKYNLIESYYLSTKYLSWRQVLFGDPLYNPFKHTEKRQKNTDLDFEAPLPLSKRIKSASTIF